jgi:hypothetical protein
MKISRKKKNRINTFKTLCVKQDEKYFFNSAIVKKVKFSMFPSNVIIKAVAHKENLRKAKEIGLLKERKNKMLRVMTEMITNGKKYTKD